MLIKFVMVEVIDLIQCSKRKGVGAQGRQDVQHDEQMIDVVIEVLVEENEQISRGDLNPLEVNVVWSSPHIWRGVLVDLLFVEMPSYSKLIRTTYSHK